jgi:shikimate kinase/3-dehydroquinate synthase
MVGRLVAARTGLAFVDTDELVEQAAGRPILELFDAEGEEQFRARESQALREALGRGPVVVAVGGGAVVREENRQQMREKGEVIWLTAQPRVLADRVGGDPSRPLLSGRDVEVTLQGLRDARGSAYADCDRRIETAGLTPDEVADAVLETPVAAEHGDHGYPVHVLSGGPGVVSAALREAFPDGARMFVVADRRAAELHGDGMAEALTQAGIEWTTFRLDTGEGSKGLGAVTRVWRQMALANVDRDTVVLGFGGGVTTDIAGYAAAAWKRGVAWVAAPTTMLGMVDAAVGGKTGVNLPEGKNLIGAFHPPVRVVMATGTLATLPRREMASGVAEAIKTALVGDAALLDLLERESEAILAGAADVLADVVRRCVRVKAAVVRADPEERNGARRVLNLGHTAGHAIEAGGGYGRFTHGEAVGLGTILACRIAVEDGSMTSEQAARVERVTAAYGLPTDTSAWAGDAVQAWRPFIRQDKKVQSGKLRFVLPEGIGRVREVGLETDELLERLGRAAAQHRRS